jgi:hypothetical protein
MSHMVYMSFDDLMKFGESIAQRAVEQALIEVNIQTDTINSRVAYKLYGKTKVRNWIKEGKLKLGVDYFKEGASTSNIIYMRKKLRELNMTVNLNERVKR